MKSIEERAKEYAENQELVPGTVEFENCLLDYIAGATEQKAIDNEGAKNAFRNACGWLSTYPWYNAVVEEFVKNIEE